MWPSGLRLHSSNQKVPGLIPRETFCIFFKKKKIKKTFFFINFKEVLCKTAKKREAKTLRNDSKKLFKKCWVLLKPSAYSGLLMLILLNKIHIIYAFKSSFCHKYSLKSYIKIFRIYCIK